MAPNHRRIEILEQLKKNGYMSVEELAKTIYVSEPTIRRDLAYLEKEGLIDRKRGGASFISTEKLQWAFALRSHSNLEDKDYIANLAAAYVENGDYIFLDGSSKCYFLARCLTGFSELNVLTHGIPALTTLGESKEIQTDCVCGTYDPLRSCIYGYEACEYISRRHAKTAFLACNSLDLTSGVMEHSPEDAAIKKAFHQNADRTILLVEHFKINRKAPYQMFPLSELYAIVTEQPLPEDLNDYCLKHDIEVVY